MENETRGLEIGFYLQPSFKNKIPTTFLSTGKISCESVYRKECMCYFVQWHDMNVLMLQ